MGNYRKGNTYWKEEIHGLLCKQWLSATTQSEYTKIHNALRPTLNYMGELILNRYFSVPNSGKQLELKKDAINFLFLRMKEFKPDKGTAYNFCGMIIKRYYYDRLVLKSERIFTMDGKVDYLDDLPETAIPVQYEQSEIDYEMVMDFFNKLKFKLKKEYKKTVKLYPRRQPVVLKRYIIFTELCIEYVEKFKDFTPANIADYIYINSEYKNKQMIVYFFKKMLNLTLGKNSIDFASTERGGVKDDRFNYILDDYSPDTDKWNRRENVRKLSIKYEDYDLYRYF